MITNEHTIEQQIQLMKVATVDKKFSVMGSNNLTLHDIYIAT
jgi:hypothetical protein